MDPPALRILMRFLRQSVHNSQHLPVLLERVFTDTNHVVQRDECAVLALQLVDKFKLNELFHPSPAHLTVGSYLALQPGCQDTVSECGCVKTDVMCSHFLLPMLVCPV